MWIFDLNNIPNQILRLNEMAVKLHKPVGKQTNKQKQNPTPGECLNKYKTYQPLI